MNNIKATELKRYIRWFTLQWHITAKCDQRCDHCYIVNHPDIWKKELQNELSLLSCYQVIDDLVRFCEILDANPFIILTGGDPLLRLDLFQLCKHAKRCGIGLKMMGNPFHLTPAIIEEMQLFGIKSYQLSIDGLEQAHDKLRKPGSFQATIEAIRLLKRKGMRTVIMFTVSSKNVSDVLDVMQLVSELQVDAFAFARFCESDSKHTVSGGVGLAPKQYRDLLIQADKLAKELKTAGSKTLFNQKDHLWKLLNYERGELAIPENPKKQIIEGCSIGRSCLSILANGTVYACRRFPSSVGKVPQQSLLEIFTSEVLDKYRQVELFEKCQSCPLLYHCRGCPAVAYSESGGNYFGPDPQCWR